jgi:hypothetical protein
MGGGLKRTIRSHPNYVIGLIVWLCAMGTIVAFPNIVPKIKFLRKACVSCSAYSRFIDTLTPEQKVDFQLLEAAAIDIAGEYYIVGKGSNEEFAFYKRNIISYQELDEIVDEKLRRLIVLNSILKSLAPGVRDLILNKKAAILYRDNRFILVGPKEALVFK